MNYNVSLIPPILWAKKRILPSEILIPKFPVCLWEVSFHVQWDITYFSCFKALDEIFVLAFMSNIALKVVFWTLKQNRTNLSTFYLQPKPLHF